MKQAVRKKKFDFCFCRWSRKSYGAFASMHKVVKIGVLCVSLSLITFRTQILFAQDTLQHGKTVLLDESLVVGRRTDALPNMVRIISSLSGEEAKLAPAQSLNDLLRYLPSVDIRQRGPVGVQADVSVRGGTFEQTQVLLNGVNFSDPQTGHHSLNLPVNMGMVSRIEVLQGLSAPGAIGGALNIVTEPNTGNSANLHVAGGQYGYLNVEGDASLGNSSFQSYLSAAHQRSDGYITNTDFSITNAYTFLSYQNSLLGKLEAQAGYQQKTFGSNGFYSFKYPNQLEATRTFLGSIRWLKSVKNLHLSALAYHRQHFDRFELFRSNPDSWYTGHNYHNTLVSGGEANAQLKTWLGLTTVAAELRNEHIYSNTLGYDMQNPRKAPFENGIYYTKHADRNTARAFLSQSVELGKLSFAGGLSLHYSSDFDLKTCFAVDGKWLVSNNVLLYGAINQALRLPTFTDLFYQTATHQANPNLKPEEATTFELGSTYMNGSMKADASVFYRLGKNTIDWVYFEGASKSQSMNHTNVDVAGVEVSWQWLPSIFNPQHFIQRLGVSYTYLHIDKSSDMQKGASYSLDQLRHKVNVDFLHLVGFQALKAQWQLCFMDRMGSYVSPGGATEPYEPTFLLNLRLLWQPALFTVYVEATNLLGVTYYDYGGIEQPKQWVNAGINIKF